ncbi:MAG: insulinase family protein [Bacteroidetes bacterium]|nr:insulinase family protein [Bacteroidota bacterium]
MNYKAPAYTDKNTETVALDLFMTMLFSEKSKLYNKLVVTEQKARSVNGNFFFTRDPYLASVQASLVDEKDMQYVRDEITKAIEEAKTKPFSENEIADAKSRLRYSFAMRMDSPSQIANNLSFFTWVTNNPESVNITYALYDKVTANDMMEAAKKYLIPTGLTISTISGHENCPIK